MVYPISATKLNAYQRCPYAYFLKYEKRVPVTTGFGSAVLGNALHDALAQCHGTWTNGDRVPDWDWVSACWSRAAANLSDKLTNKQVREGRSILENYYQKFIATEPTFRQPLAVEGKIQATLQFENLEFSVTGRYDRIDYLDDGLELIDYKSTQTTTVPEKAEMDVQLGLYGLALEQTYGQSLKYLSLLFLRSGEKVRYRATDRQKRQVLRVLKDLAWQVRHENHDWHAKPGKQCGGCSYSQYCVAVNQTPAPEPIGTKIPSLQLAFSLSA
jgi:putative RecB family exonuclease